MSSFAIQAITAAPLACRHSTQRIGGNFTLTMELSCLQHRLCACPFEDFVKQLKAPDERVWSRKPKKILKTRPQGLIDDTDDQRSGVYVFEVPELVFAGMMDCNQPATATPNWPGGLERRAREEERAGPRGAQFQSSRIAIRCIERHAGLSSTNDLRSETRVVPGYGGRAIDAADVPVVRHGFGGSGHGK